MLRRCFPALLLLAARTALSQNSLISQSTAGVQGNADSAGEYADGTPRVLAASSDGRRVAFLSRADNLTPAGDVDYSVFPNELNLFLRIIHPDCTVETRCISVDNSVFPAIALGRVRSIDISNDGEFVFFCANFTTYIKPLDYYGSFASGGGSSNVMRYEVDSGVLDCVTCDVGSPISLGGCSNYGYWGVSSISTTTSGSRIAFVLTDNTGGPTCAASMVYRDVSPTLGSFVPLVITGTSLAMFGDNPRLSGNGEFIAFSSATDPRTPDTSLTKQQVWRADLANGTYVLVSASTTGVPTTDGDNGNTILGGDQFDISENGNFVAFASDSLQVAPTLPSPPPEYAHMIYRRNISLAQTAVASQTSTGQWANHICWQQAISGSGASVTFLSVASNFPMSNGTTAVYRRNFTPTFLLQRQDRASTGGAPNSGATLGTISSSGSHVIFGSSATNIIPGGTSGVNHVFSRGLYSCTF